MKNKIQEYIKTIMKQLDKKLESTIHWINIRGGGSFRTNVILFGISLFISMVVWAFVAWDGNTDGTRTMSVNVEYSNIQRGYSIYNNSRKVELSLVGRINALSRVGQSEVSARVDLQGLHPGKYSLPINIEVPSYVRVKGWKPTTVDVEIYRHVERTIPISWRVEGDLPDGMVVSSVDIKPAVATLSGPEAEVLSVQNLEVVIPSDKLSSTDSIPLSLSIANTSMDTERLSITPQNVNVKVFLENEILGERIPVKVSVVGQPAEGLEIESVKVIPEHVTIRGRSEAVKKMTSLVLPPVDISGLDQNLNLLLPLQPADISPEVEITGPDRARVEITIRRIMSVKTFANVGIMTEGGKTGREWKISPQSVRLTIEGSQLAIQELQSGNIPCELYINVSNIVSKQLSLPVLVKNLKKDFQVVRIEPEQVIVTSLE